MSLNPDIPAELVGLGVATLHEASGRRGLAFGLRLVVGEGFAGPAVTVGLPAGDNLGIHLALEAAEAGSVVCVSSGGAGAYGVFGDLLQEAARAGRIAGLVIDDGVRDTAELRPPPGIACRGFTALGTVKRRVRQAVGAQVAVGGVLVCPGDWVVADRDGVFVLPQDCADQIIGASRRRVQREAELRTQLRAGAVSRELFGLPTEAVPSVS
jgi:4-hydroxy-4-methyl-2-oxoglutarate aldolase